MADWFKLLLEDDGGSVDRVQAPTPRPPPTVAPIPQFGQQRQRQPANRLAPQPEQPQGYQPPPGYSIRKEGTVSPWVYDKDGAISEVPNLPEASAYMERNVREEFARGRGTPERLRELNRMRGAMGERPLTEQDLRAPAQAAPQAPSRPVPRQDWARELLGEDAPQSRPMPQRMARPAADPNATPDAPTWIGRRIQDIRGKRDPRYADAPNIAAEIRRMDGDTFSQTGSEIGGWLMAASDEDMAKYYQAMLGNRFVGIDKDANGYPIIRYRDETGAEKVGYVNSPGLDSQDVARGLYGALPYVATGMGAGALLKGAPLLGRAGGQAVTAAGTSLGQDAAAFGTGTSLLNLERSAVKAGVAAAGGAGAEFVGAALGALARKFIREPRYYNAQAQTLTPEGEAAARQAGVDPAALTQQMARDFGKQMARTGDPVASTRQVVSNEFGIPRTQGELTGAKNQLLREQQIRGGTYGDRPAQMMQNFDKQQRSAVEQAVAGFDGKNMAGGPSIAAELAPGRAGRIMSKGDLGQTIRQNTAATRDVAKGFERQAWEALPDLRVTPEAIKELPDAITQGLKSKNITFIEEGLTPQAKRMSDLLENFEAGKMPASASKYAPASPDGHIDTMRRRLFAELQKADPGSPDARAAGALYDSFNDWVLRAADLAGDKRAGVQMRIARGMTRAVKGLFEGKKGTPGARILSDVLEKQDSAEGVINALFTGSKSDGRKGAVDALKSLNAAYKKFLPPDKAKAHWDDIRLAYWLKMTSDKGGNVPGPQALASSIKAANEQQGTIMKLLYSPQEREMMMRLAGIMDDLKQKNPNSSWSGIAVGALLKDIGDSLLTMLGMKSTTARIAGSMLTSPIRSQYGAVQASKATGGGMGATVPALPPPSLGPYGAALGGNTSNNR